MRKDTPEDRGNVSELGSEQHASVDEKLRKMFQLIGAEVRKVNQSCVNVESKTIKMLQKFKEELRRENRLLQEQFENLSIQLERERNIIAELREQLQFLSSAMQRRSSTNNSWSGGKEGMESSNTKLSISSAFWTVARWFYLIFICFVKGAHFVVQPLVDTVEIMADNFVRVKVEDSQGNHDSLEKTLRFSDDVNTITGQPVFIASAFCKMESIDGSCTKPSCDLLKLSDLSNSVLNSDVDILHLDFHLIESRKDASLTKAERNSGNNLSGFSEEILLPLRKPCSLRKSS